MPQPDPPSRPKISPLAMERLTFSTAWKVPNRFDTPSIRMNGAGPDATEASGAEVGCTAICMFATINRS